MKRAAEYFRQRRARLAIEAWVARDRTSKPFNWTPEEDQIARGMRSRRKTYGQIARRINRTPDAVYTRLRDYSEASR